MTLARPVAQSLFPDVVADKPIGYLLPSVMSGVNADLIAAVAPFYVHGSVMDATYGRGGWWKRHRPEQLVAHDLDPAKGDGVDFRHLPEADATYDTVAFDPPYIPTTGRLETTTEPEFRDMFGLVSRTPAELWKLIDRGMHECTRVLRPGGHLLVKCMDYSNGRQFILGHVRVLRIAEQLPLLTQDLIVHHSGAGPGSGARMWTQKRARRAHSYLLVFRKRRDR